MTSRGYKSFQSYFIDERVSFLSSLQLCHTVTADILVVFGGAVGAAAITAIEV